MTALGHMILANFRMNLRNRMALFWNLAFPLIFIVLFGYLFNTGGFSAISVGIAGSQTSEVSEAIYQGFSTNDAFNVSEGSEGDELQALRDGDRSAVVVLGEGASEGQVSATVYYDDTDPQQAAIVQSTVQGYLDQFNLEALGENRPVTVASEGIASTDIRYMDFLVPGLLAMSIMNTSLIGLASAFVSYREKGILRRIKATPFPLSQFIFAKIVTQLSIAVAQAVILITVGRILFDLQIDGSYINILVMVMLGGLAFLSVGFVVSSFARNQEAADALSNAIAFPMLFLAGVFFPVDSAPAWLQVITRLMPLRYLADGMRSVMVEGGTLPEQWLNIIILLATAAIGTLLSLRLFRWESQAS